MSQNYAGVYGHIKFPPYVHREYPKWIKGKNGKPLLVKNQQEEIQNQFEMIDGVEQPVDPVVRERDALAGQVALLQAKLEAIEMASQAAKAPVPTPVPPSVTRPALKKDSA
jgi:hypothetical protein